MTENIITVALVAIATIAVVTLFGNNLRALFGMSGDALAGNDNVVNRTHRSMGGEKKNMSNFATSSGGTSGGGGPYSKTTQ